MIFGYLVQRIFHVYGNVDELLQELSFLVFSDRPPLLPFLNDTIRATRKWEALCIFRLTIAFVPQIILPPSDEVVLGVAPFHSLPLPSL